MNRIEELDQQLVQPSPALIDDLAAIDGDILVLGVGGKMGPSLAKLAKRAIDQSGLNKKVIGVSRFSTPKLRLELESYGIETIAADLLNENELDALPDVKNVLYMVGKKFGTTGNEHLTWAMNTYLPGRVAEKYRNSRIVVFSSGNIYPFTSIYSGGVSEETAPEPIGEYAQSCLGRERIFTHFGHLYNIPMLQFRLNYAIDFRYGILLEVAQAVRNEQPIDVRMGHVNVIWQGDANEMALRCFNHCTTPPRIMNITGPETVSIRWLATRFAEQIGKEPFFAGEEQEMVLLSNASKAHQTFGYPRVSMRQMIEWTVEWLELGGEVSDKPTHFQERGGVF